LEYAWEWDALSKVKNTNDAYLFSRQKKKKRKKGSDIRDKKKKKTPSQSVSERTIIYFVLFAARLSSPFSKNKIWRK
jgi:hypothetical protein